MRSTWDIVMSCLALYFRQIILLFFGLFTLFGLGLWGGYELACKRFVENQGSLFADWEKYIRVDREKIKTLEEETTQHLRVLTQHMGRIEANLIRINALGERLIEQANLDPHEFNFNQEVPLGGPIGERTGDSMAISLKELDATLERKFAQINSLHCALLSRLGQGDLAFSGSGKPVNGWVSSFFGKRADPFTGHKAWHAGVDIVAKEGSEVKALAGGVISYANKKGGYGTLVEINHGNGLSTRYGHNKRVLVTEGQLVKKGQSIALLGSSGRSTGPHVHLEVHKNGRPVDPGEYFPELKRH